MAANNISLLNHVNNMKLFVVVKHFNVQAVCQDLQYFLHYLTLQLYNDNNKSSNYGKFNALSAISLLYQSSHYKTMTFKINLFVDNKWNTETWLSNYANIWNLSSLIEKNIFLNKI